MSSSTSSSETPRAAPASWRRFAIAFLGTALALLVVLIGFVALVDPFDAGMFGEPHRGLAEQAPRTANASRARDPAYDAAILGNSHIQLVDPAALSRGTGLAFVSLTVPGTGPREQLAILDAFLRHHRGTARALVFGLDPAWCTEDPALPISNPFPFWLYDPSRLAYLGGLVRYAALEQAVRQVGLALGLGRPARRDGYWNYAAGRTPGAPVLGVAAAETPGDTKIGDTGRFPALDRLGTRLAALPDDTAVVLVRPPVHAATLPRPGSAPARAEAACRRVEDDLVRRHRATALVDLRTDGPTARDPNLWFDATHYAEPLARVVEERIVAAIAGLRG